LRHLLIAIDEPPLGWASKPAHHAPSPDRAS
jgi:hypothetical protein